jgi:hypothetical protein
VCSIEKNEKWIRTDCGHESEHVAVNQGILWVSQESPAKETRPPSRQTLYSSYMTKIHVRFDITPVVKM